MTNSEYDGHTVALEEDGTEPADENAVDVPEEGDAGVGGVPLDDGDV